MLKTTIFKTIATIDMNDYLVISIKGNEDDSDFTKEYPRIKMLLARNSKILTNEQKKELINALLSDTAENNDATF